jgi:hypothetical protein
MLFTNRQIADITSSVDFHHALFCLNETGPGVLSKADKTLLIKNGIDLDSYKGKISTVEYSYNFGRMESNIRDKGALKKLNLKDYKKFVDSNPEQFKLTKEDRYNIKVAQQRLYNDIKRVGADIKADLTQQLIEVSKTYPDARETKSGTRKVLNVISKKLAESNKKYASRFTKISSYNMHSCYQEGIAAQILKDAGPNAKIWYSVHPDACLHCVKTYLRNGRGSQPRVFYLKTVIANGSNIGRTAKQYRASLQPLHPHCRCKMNSYPSKGKVKWSPRQNRYIRIFS